jgi:hypothetical protein
MASCNILECGECHVWAKKKIAFQVSRGHHKSDLLGRHNKTHIGSENKTGHVSFQKGFFSYLSFFVASLSFFFCAPPLEIVLLFRKREPANNTNRKDTVNAFCKVE